MLPQRLAERHIDVKASFTIYHRPTYMLSLIQRRSRTRSRLLRSFSTSQILSQTTEDNAQGNTTIDDAVKKIRSSLAKKKRKEVLAELRGTVAVKPLTQIQQECDDRFYKRFIKPSVNWQHKVKRSIEVAREEKIDQNKKFLEIFRDKLQKSPESLKVNDFFLPLDLGDVVELSTSLNQSGLAVIVELPSRDDDPRYTVMNRLGELSYLEKSSFKFRIPRLIPKDRLYGLVYEVKDQDVEDYGSIRMEATGFTKYAVNPFARSFIMQPILDISNTAWENLQGTSIKLEIVHRLVQHDLGPREISTLTLVRAVEELDLDKFRSDIKNHSIADAYSNLRNHLLKTVGGDFNAQHRLGRPFSRLSPHETFDISAFYSVILALRKHTRLWSNSYNSKSTLFPLTVTALPLQYTSRLDMVSDIASHDHELVKGFHKFVASNLNLSHTEREDFEIPAKFNDLFFLLKEYAVGNLKDDKLETLISLLMKVHHPNEDITKFLVYNFLVKFDIIPSTLANPTHYSTHLSLPNKGISEKSDQEQQLYDTIDSLEEIFEDDLAKNRTDLTHLKVFCIDSEKAHEIDDGISLEKLSEKGDFKVYVHIADPSSFINKESPLFRIAFDRAFTVYQPEMVSTMLPNRISQVAGLGIDGQKTRAITFSIPFNVNEKVIDFAKGKVEASYISQFQNGYYYSKVDQILNRKNDEAAATGIERENVAQLFDMFKIAQILRDLRIESGGVIFGESIGLQIRVDETSGKLEDFRIDQPSITKSNTLVSEFMILANRISGEFIKRKRIPGVYKIMNTLPLNMPNISILDKLNQLSKTPKNYPSLSEIVKLFKFISSSSYSSNGNVEHSMLGCANYAPSTSPLRRIGDMINHYQFHTYFNTNGTNVMFDEDEVLAMTLHIESKNDIIKRTSKIANSFYVISHFKSLVDNKALNSFDIVISSKVADGGSVVGILRNFGVFVNLKYHLGRAPPNLGDIITVELQSNGEYNVEFLEFDAVGNSVKIKEL